MGEPTAFTTRSIILALLCGVVVFLVQPLPLLAGSRLQHAVGDSGTEFDASEEFDRIVVSAFWSTPDFLGGVLTFTLVLMLHVKVLKVLRGTRITKVLLLTGASLSGYLLGQLIVWSATPGTVAATDIVWLLLSPIYMGHGPVVALIAVGFSLWVTRGHQSRTSMMSPYLQERYGKGSQ